MSQRTSPTSRILSLGMFWILAAGQLLAAPPDSSNSPATEPQPAAIQLTLDLLDGSRLIGSPELRHAEVSFDTKLGRVSVPLNELEAIEIAADRETAILKFANGDRLSGFPVEDGLPVKSILGRLVVPWAAMSRCVVNSVSDATGIASLKPLAVSASGSWRDSQRPEMACDGDPQTSWSSGDWKGWIEFDLGAVCELDEIRATLQFSPSGSAAHEFYVSTTPMGNALDEARLLEVVSGERSNRDQLTVECPGGTKARFVQIRCPWSPSWFNLFEVEFIP